MEASVAAGQGGDAGQQPGGAQAPGAPAEGGADLSQMLAAMQQGQEEMRQLLIKQNAPAAPAEPAAPELDLSGLFGEPEPDPYGGFDPSDFAQKLAPSINQLIAEQSQAAVAPLQQQVQSMQVAARAQALATEFPDLQEPEIATQVVTTARQLAQQLGHPELGENVDFWRLVYMGGRASQMHEEDGAESPSAAHLEGGAGARPGAQQADPVAGLFSQSTARLGRRALPFH